MNPFFSFLVGAPFFAAAQQRNQSSNIFTYIAIAALLLLVSAGFIIVGNSYGAGVYGGVLLGLALAGIAACVFLIVRAIYLRRQMRRAAAGALGFLGLSALPLLFGKFIRTHKGVAGNLLKEAEAAINEIEDEEKKALLLKLINRGRRIFFFGKEAADKNRKEATATETRYYAQEVTDRRLGGKQQFGNAPINPEEITKAVIAAMEETFKLERRPARVYADFLVMHPGSIGEKTWEAIQLLQNAGAIKPLARTKVEVADSGIDCKIDATKVFGAENFASAAYRYLRDAGLIEENRDITDEIYA